MRTSVLGILNVTPDSFSDGGQSLDHALACRRAEEMVAEGASIVDVGGESTRPGATEVSVDEELRRVIPVVERVARFSRVSIDTRKAEVARAAVEAGASIINDVSASLWPVAAELQVGWIALHMQGEPETMQQRPCYQDVVAEVREFLVDRARVATEAGVGEIWIDPGFGFGKTFEQNMALLSNLDLLTNTGLPVVVGLSRKAMLGKLLGRSDGDDDPAVIGDRLEGSVGGAALACLLGASLIRAHDVKATCQALTVAAAGPQFAGGRNGGYGHQFIRDANHGW